MKKALALCVMTLLLPWAVLAQEPELISVETVDEDELAEDAGWLPDHPLYWLKKGWERVQSFLTFDAEKKADLEAKFAEKRLAEMIACRKFGKNNLIKKLTDDYEAALNRTQTALRNYGEGMANKIRNTIRNQFARFNQSVEEGVYPEEIEIINNKTLELSSEYTNQTVFTPEELRDFVWELLVEADESEDWTVKKDLVTLAARLVWEAKKTINPGEELDIEIDENKTEQVALRVAASTAKHLSVLNNVLEQAPEAAKQGLMNAINKSQIGHVRAIVAVSKRARVEWNNTEVGELLRNREEVKEQFKYRIQEAVPKLKVQIKDRIREHAEQGQVLGNITQNQTTAETENEGETQQPTEQGCTTCGSGGQGQSGNAGK